MNTIYLAMGDSLTTGYGVGPNQSFAALFYKHLLADNPGLQYINLGVNGLTSGELVSMAAQKRFQSLIAQAGIISLTIGSNDLLGVGKRLISGAGDNIDLTLGELNRNLMLIGGHIRTINPNALVKIATIYNPLPPINKQSAAFAYAMLKSANRGISHTAREFRFVVVPVAKAFSGKEQLLLSQDRLHPNVMGHSVMAELFIR